MFVSGKYSGSATAILSQNHLKRYFDKIRSSLRVCHVFPAEVAALELVLEVVVVGVLAVVLLRERHDLLHVATYVKKYLSINQKRVLFFSCFFAERPCYAIDFEKN